MLESNHRAALASIVGPAGFIVAPEDRAAYETAARYGGGKAAAVVRPSTAAQVCAVLRYCVQTGIRYIPQSGNTGLVSGSTPDDSGTQIILSLDRLRSAPGIDVADRTVQVTAGTRLSELNLALEPHGLFLPIDVSADPMIGGMVATNTGGARFLKYGDMRRHVLGLEVALPDEAGTLLQLSGGLRKDNSHLALRQLFIGSCGAFGIITAATLEVHPRPKQAVAAILVPRDEAAVIELLIAFESEAGECLTAFEGISGSAMRRALARFPSLRNPFPEAIPPYVVLMELASSSPCEPGGSTLEARLEAIVTRLAQRESAPVTDARFGQSGHLWAIRHSLSEALRLDGPVVGFDLSFRRGDVMRFRRAAIELLASEFPDYEVCDFGHVADGGVHFNLVGRGGFETDSQRVSELRTRVHTIAIEDFGASFSGEHGIGRANQSAYDHFIPTAIQRYSAAVSDVFSRIPAAAVRFGPPSVERSNS
jgi:FAD/FMN-containing dehydrogenase